MTYDWRKTFTSAVKAGAFVSIGLIIADPNLVPAAALLVPEQYRPLVALMLPAILAALKNWLQNRGKV